ncbi:MAG: hypothetical protein EOO75_04955 [Myxococcales bacterium]|nr:MAG: hypothetical protein EOO75_04955 [Myxococcales bacterium]
MSKLIERRKTGVEVVASAAETHAARIQERFAELVTPHLQPADKGKVPDLGRALALGARALRASGERFIAADEAHTRELADDAAPREVCDESAATLLSELTALREVIQTTYGAEGLRQCGFQGSTPDDPRVLEALAGRVLTRLKDKKKAWPAATKKGLSLDPSAWVASLEEPLAPLRRSLGDVQREVREAQATADARTRAQADHDALFGRVATLIAAALRLVGDEPLAARVRPSGRRPGTLAQPGEEGGGEGEGEG